MKVLGLLLLFPALIYACTPDPEPRLTGADRILIDSLYRLEIKTLKPQLDSLCEATFDQEVQRMVDSLFQDRLDDMYRQLERIKPYK